MKNKLKVLYMFCFMAMASVSHAQELDSLYDLSLEDLMNITITTASKQEESLADAAAVVSVITSKDIQSYGALSLVDVLDRATNTYFFSGFTYRDNMLSIRGNATADVNTNVLLLIDGRPFRESLTNGLNSPLYASFPLDRIERIEIIRGPGSILYGTCAVVGVINVITKGAEQSSPIAASIRYGTFNTLQGNLSAARKFGKLSIAGGATLLNTDGWKMTTLGQPIYVPNPVTGTPVLANPNPSSADLYKNNVGANLVASVGGLKLSANYLKSKQANMGDEPFWVDFANPVENATDFNANIDRLMIDLGYEKSFGQKWKASLNLTNNMMQMEKRYAVYPNLRDEADTRDHLLEFTNYITPVKNLNIVVGGLLNYQTGDLDTYQRKGDEDVALSQEPNNEPYHVTGYDQLWWSFYTQANYKVTDYLKLVAGVQGNKVTNLDIDFVPRVGGIVNFSEHLGAKVLYGKSFRSPSQYERNANNLPIIMANPSLAPEKIGTFETQLFVTQKQYEVYLTYYQSTQTDVIHQQAFPYEYRPGVFIPLTQYVNGSKFKSSGVELEGKAFLTSALSLNASASYQESRDEQDEEYSFGVPSFMGKLGVNYTAPFGLSVSVFNSYFGKPANTDLPTTVKINPAASAYNYLSANVQYNISKLYNGKSPLTLGLYVTNLLDEEVYYPEYFNRSINTLPGRAGRAVYGSLTYRF